ncbi:hypothetical protein EAY39_10605 [Vibrio anguillarum]|uniref:hypothetical protein n=2 Tax=Vibrio anguillarum TaxID=55601 RepID=UPI0018C20F70|nr:hypothetical protein [Vibrio anguillarum]MBF4341232.1 hypothetical protein [Vibrio anguillarum]
MKKDEYRIDYWKKLYDVDLNVKLVVLETDEFMVWIDSNDQIDWITHDEKFDALAQKDSAKREHREIASEVTLLECTPNNELSNDTVLKFKKILGEALACSFKEEFTSAKKLLIEAKELIDSRGQEQARHWQLMASGWIVLVATLTAGIVWLNKQVVISMIGKDMFILLYAIVAASMGAFLSQILRLGKESLDCHAGKNLHEWESRFKISAAMISTIIITLALRSELVAAQLMSFEHVNEITVLFGFLGGISERLIPSITKKLEAVK